MTRGALQRGKVPWDEDTDKPGFSPCSGTIFSLHPRTAELLPAGPQVGAPVPLLPCPLLCSRPAAGVVITRMPGALERTQGLVKKAAGILPHVCKLRSALRLLLLLFVFLSAPNSLSLCCRYCRPAQKGSNKGVVRAGGWWDSKRPPVLMGRAGTGLALVSEELLHFQLVPGSWCLRMAQPWEGAANATFGAEIFLPTSFGSGFWD